MPATGVVGLEARIGCDKEHRSEATHGITGGCGVERPPVASLPFW
jgi:hypothetical protein